MSGFEVAGIVLGAFPLAISALEGYRQLARRMKFFHEIREEYQKCLNDLRYNRLRFHRNIKQLLIPLGADKAEVNDLLANPGGEVWSNHPIATALEARLEESYSLYLDTIDSIKITMDELNSELAMDVRGFQERVHQKKVRYASITQVGTRYDTGFRPQVEHLAILLPKFTAPLRNPTKNSRCTG